MDAKLKALVEEYNKLSTPYDHRDWQWKRGQEIKEAILERVFELYNEDQATLQIMSDLCGFDVEKFLYSMTIDND